MIKNYIKAGYPLLAIKTTEPLRAAVAAAADANGRAVVQWDCNRGYQTLGENFWTEADPYAIPDAAAAKPGTVWLLKNFHFWLKEAPVIQAIQNNIPTYKAQGITLIIIAPDLDPPLELSRDIHFINFTMPDRDSLGTILDGLTEAQSLTLDAERRQTVIDSLMGLTWEEAENALAYGLVTDQELNPATISALKIKMVENIPGLSFSKFRETFSNLAANGNLKTWTLNRFARRRTGLPFRGILILGAPGCGKSHFTKALGNEVGWPVMILDFGRIMGSLVGQSEAQLDQVLKTIDALAPAIVIVEEIEKALAGATGTSGDGGTTQRMIGKFLTWLQDHESEIFVVATCNEYSTLAAFSGGAFVRSGRWDATFFVDLPNQEERRQILDLYLKQFCPDLRRLGPETLPDLPGYSGAELRQVAIECAYNGGDLMEAINFVIPLSRTNKEQIDSLRTWATGRTIPATLPEQTAATSGRAIKF